MVLLVHGMNNSAERKNNIMAAKPNIKFMGVKGGAIHVITTKREDMEHSKCVTVKKGHTGPGWRGKSLSPEAALDLKGCIRCDTHAVAEVERKARMTPAQKAAETRRKRDETIQKITDASKPKGKGKKHSDKDGSGKNPKRRGPRGGEKDQRMQENAEEHAAFAKALGWRTTAESTAVHEWTTVAKRDGETLKIIWRDGRVMFSRVVLASGVEVRLRNSANWKKHASGKSGIKPTHVPKGGRGKKAAKVETGEDDLTTAKDLPFNIETDDPETIIESLLGKQITWRRATDNRLDSSRVPQRSRNCRMTVHPKSGRLMISFYESQGQGEAGEVIGGERSVFVDKIIRATGGGVQVGEEAV